MQLEARIRLQWIFYRLSMAFAASSVGGLLAAPAKTSISSAKRGAVARKGIVHSIAVANMGKRNRCMTEHTTMNPSDNVIYR